MSRKLKSFIPITCLMLALCLMLMSCVSDPESFYFDYDELKQNVVSIELINYDNSDVKTVKKRTDILPFDFSKVEILETLESEQLEKLLQTLSEIHFHVCDDLTKYFSSAAGISIRITYANGSFIVVCLNQKTNFAGAFTADGNVGELILMFPTHAFADLVNKYFTTQVE